MSCSLLSLPEPSTVPGKQWTLFKYLVNDNLEITIIPIVSRG